MTHLQREIDKLKRKILALGALVEDVLRLSFQAIEERDALKAQRVVATDLVIDEQEVEVEEECLKILALYQPVAGDLRFLVAVIKINSELERIGDLASNVAERALSLSQEHPVPVPAVLTVMADRTGAILEKALDALVRQDVDTARCVLGADDEIDRLYHAIIEETKTLMAADGGNVERGLRIVFAAHYLERAGDRMTNIAEDVVFLATGHVEDLNQ